MVIPAAAHASDGATPAMLAPEAESAPLLSVEMVDQGDDLEQRELSRDIITESMHSLRLRLGIVGDLQVDQIKPKHLWAFWGGVRWWLANATVKPKYRHLSVVETIAKWKEEKVPVPSLHTRNKRRQRLGVFFNALVSMSRPSFRLFFMPHFHLSDGSVIRQQEKPSKGRVTTDRGDIVSLGVGPYQNRICHNGHMSMARYASACQRRGLAPAILVHSR